MTKKRVKFFKKSKFERLLDRVFSELWSDCKGMVNWILFYKPHGLTDKVLHIIEVASVWIVITKLFGGI